MQELEFVVKETLAAKDSHVVLEAVEVAVEKVLLVITALMALEEMAAMEEQTL
jgi:hypothetical protein